MNHFKIDDPSINKLLRSKYDEFNFEWLLIKHTLHQGHFKLFRSKIFLKFYSFHIIFIRSIVFFLTLNILNIVNGKGFKKYALLIYINVDTRLLKILKKRRYHFFNIFISIKFFSKIYILKEHNLNVNPPLKRIYSVFLDSHCYGHPDSMPRSFVRNLPGDFFLDELVVPYCKRIISSVDLNNTAPIVVLHPRTWESIFGRTISTIKLDGILLVNGIEKLAAVVGSNFPAHCLFYFQAGSCATNLKNSFIYLKMRHLLVENFIFLKFDNFFLTILASALNKLKFCEQSSILINSKDSSIYNNYKAVEGIFSYISKQ